MKVEVVETLKSTIAERRRGGDADVSAERGLAWHWRLWPWHDVYDYIINSSKKGQVKEAEAKERSRRHHSTKIVR